MAIGIGSKRADGSTEIVAIFKYDDALKTVGDLVLGVQKRGFEAETLVDLKWPFPDRDNIWGGEEVE